MRYSKFSFPDKQQLDNTIIKHSQCFLVTDIDECAEKTDTCDKHSACTNTIGSFTCTCQDGYSGDGHVCKGKNMTAEYSYA